MKDAKIIDVGDAAYMWWRTKRPLAWSQEMHLANPRINCASDAEIALALAVATWIKP